jgi:hypothetical protein
MTQITKSDGEVTNPAADSELALKKTTRNDQEPGGKNPQQEKKGTLLCNTSISATQP